MKNVIVNLLITVEFSLAIQFLNCSESRRPISKEPHVTFCIFDNFKLSEVFETQVLIICFKPKKTFQYLKISIANVSNSHYDEIAKVGAKTNVWSEVSTTIDKFSADNIDNYLFQVYDGNKNVHKGEPSSWEVNNGKKLVLAFYGAWEGSRQFSTENDTESTNCEERGTTSSINLNYEESDVTTEVIVDGYEENEDGIKEGIASHYVLFLVGLSILVLFLICTAVGVPRYRKKR